jgi:hypothetical protein
MPEPLRSAHFYRPWKQTDFRGTLNKDKLRIASPERTATVLLRCVLDGLLLYATVRADPPILLAFDGDESFALEAIEALYYEIVLATRDELLALERACFRLLRPSSDFRHIEDGDAASA